MAKINLLILFGGESTEHSISNISASNILEAIDQKKYNITKIGITRDGKWYLVNSSVADIKSGEWVNHLRHQAIVSPSKLNKGILILKGNEFEEIGIDVCFPILHGINGEDGTVQALLKLAGIRCVGADFLSSAVGMHKKFTKIILSEAEIPVVPSLYIEKNEYIKNIENLEKIKFELPCFVKPANSGSSVGATAVFKAVDFIPAVKAAFKIDSCVLVEKYIECREIECAVIGNDDIFVSHPGEISTTSEFYDFDTKYVNTGGVSLSIPAEIDKNTEKAIMEYAKKAYKILGLSGMTRIDFFIDKKTSEIYLNEVNTIPGFTSLSMYPLLLLEEGFTYPKLIDKLIELAR